jgi:hypothetical protein
MPLRIISETEHKFEKPGFTLQAGEHTYDGLPDKHRRAVLDLTKTGKVQVFGMSKRAFVADMDPADRAEYQKASDAARQARRDKEAALDAARRGGDRKAADAATARANQLSAKRMTVGNKARRAAARPAPSPAPRSKAPKKSDDAKTED